MFKPLLIMSLRRILIFFWKKIGGTIKDWSLNCLKISCCVNLSWSSAKKMLNRVARKQTISIFWENVTRSVWSRSLPKALSKERRYFVRGCRRKRRPNDFFSTFIPPSIFHIGYNTTFIDKIGLSITIVNCSSPQRLKINCLLLFLRHRCGSFLFLQA